MTKRASVYFDHTTKQFNGLTQAVHKSLHERFPDIDIDIELIKMIDWLQSDKGKRRIGNIGFIINWLNNASPVKLSVDEGLQIMYSDETLSPLYQDYLKELWKDREHILQLNMISRK